MLSSFIELYQFDCALLQKTRMCQLKHVRITVNFHIGIETKGDVNLFFDQILKKIDKETQSETRTAYMHKKHT